MTLERTNLGVFDKNPEKYTLCHEARHRNASVPRNLPLAGAAGREDFDLGRVLRDGRRSSMGPTFLARLSDSGTNSIPAGQTVGSFARSQ